MNSPPNRSAKALALSLLRADLRYRLIPAAQREPLVHAALADGRLLAETARACWGADPWDIAFACELPVIESERDAGFGSTVLFADYVARPACITVYRPRIAQLNELLRTSGWGQELRLEDTRAVFLAHELYHHFDCEGGSMFPRPAVDLHQNRFFHHPRHRHLSGKQAY